MVKQRRIPRTESPRERDAWRRTQDDDNTNKMDKRPTAAEDSIVVFDSDGNSKDSGVSIDSVEAGFRRSYFYARVY